MKYLFLLFVTVLLLSCHFENEKKINDEPVIIPVSPIRLSFFDSIYRKYELTLEQMQSHTGIDSFYYTGLYAGAQFTGDTILQLYKGFTGAVIDYSDNRNCGKKIFLVFPSSAEVATDYKEIETSCDRDFSGNYFYIRYKLLSDSSLETIEYFIPPNKDEDDTGTVWERIKYKINQKGTIDTIAIKRNDF
jgi:hypothetical protein